MSKSIIQQLRGSFKNLPLVGENNLQWWNLLLYFLSSSPSGPRAVQDGSGAAMGVHSQTCLLFLVFLPFLLRFWRDEFEHKWWLCVCVCVCVCVYVCVCGCLCVWLTFFFPTGNINWCTVSAWIVLLHNDVDPLNKSVTNISFVFLDFKDVTNDLHLNWIMLDIFSF